MPVELLLGKRLTTTALTASTARERRNREHYGDCSVTQVNIWTA